MRGVLCVVYVSEALNAGVIDNLRAVCRDALIHSFSDAVYNRTSFYLTGPQLWPRLLAVCQLALTAIDLAQHRGTHPRLGVVDNICFSPLTDDRAALADAVRLAQELGLVLQRDHRVPVFFYAAASAQNRRLADIRRALGYFQSPPLATTTIASAVAADDDDASLALAPEFDWPTTRRHGVACVGASALVHNLNVRFAAQQSINAVRRVTAGIRGAQVEALTLPHADGRVEVACNLLGLSAADCEREIERIRGQILALAAAQALVVSDAYLTAPTLAALVQRSRDQGLL